MLVQTIKYDSNTMCNIDSQGIDKRNKMFYFFNNNVLLFYMRNFYQ